MKKLFLGLLAGLLLVANPAAAQLSYATTSKASTGTLVDMGVRGYTGVNVAYSGTYAGVTVNYEQSADPSGSTWYPVLCVQADTGSSATAGSTANKGYFCPVTGSRFRAVIAAYSSGTVTVKYSLSAISNPALLNPGSGGGGGGSGDASVAEQQAGNASLAAIDTKLGVQAGYLDGVEALIAATNGYVDGLETQGTANNASVASIDTKMTTQNGYLDQLEGYTDGIEGLITSTNTKLDTLDTRVDTLEALITSTNTKMDTLITAAQDTTAVATTTSPCTPFGLRSAATNNSTNVKSSAGTLCGGLAINTTATLYYLKIYNLAAAPTCSSATGLVTVIPIPASTTGAGTQLNFGAGGLTLSTGLGFCITGALADTDNTSAVAGISLTFGYR